MLHHLFHLALNKDHKPHWNLNFLLLKNNQNWKNSFDVKFEMLQFNTVANEVSTCIPLTFGNGCHEDVSSHCWMK